MYIDNWWFILINFGFPWFRRRSYGGPTKNSVFVCKWRPKKKLWLNSWIQEMTEALVHVFFFFVFDEMAAFPKKLFTFLFTKWPKVKVIFKHIIPSSIVRQKLLRSSCKNFKPIDWAVSEKLSTVWKVFREKSVYSFGSRLH